MSSTRTGAPRSATSCCTGAASFAQAIRSEAFRKPPVSGHRVWCFRWDSYSERARRCLFVIARIESRALSGRLVVSKCLPADSELAHTGTQGVRVDREQAGGTVRALDAASRALE